MRWERGRASRAVCGLAGEGREVHPDPDPNPNQEGRAPSARQQAALPLPLLLSLPLTLTHPVHVQSRPGSKQQPGAADAVLLVECSSVQRVEAPRLAGQDTEYNGVG